MLIRPLFRVLAVVALFALLVLAGAAWFYVQANPFGSPGRDVVVTVTPGESLTTLAGRLQARGVISSSLAFRADTAVYGSFNVRPGAYEVPQNSSFGTVRGIFSKAPNAAQVFVEPGLTLAEIATNIGDVEGATYQSQFTAAAQSAAETSPWAPDNTLEGLIGPGTYLIRPHESAASLVAAMTSSFTKEAAAEGLTPQTHLDGLNAYQLIVAASIVQKEGYYNRNMERVARVIFNRLAIGDALQMDSTVLYYFHQDGGVPTAAQEQANTPYNTYTHAGLTPTPICTPSAFALHSMVDPASGHWLYFVLVTRSGTMAFAVTYAEQLHNEQIAAERGVS